MAHQVLSLGAGIQSTTVLLMSERGELPDLDAAIFSDTGWEPKAVYDHLAWLEQQTRIPVYRVGAGDLREHTLRGVVRGSKSGGDRYASLPLFVKNGDGSVGQITRQCTREYKIEPIHAFIKRELLGLQRGQHAPLHAVDHWYGISADEPRRMRISREHWKRNIYPLCNMPRPFLAEPMSRGQCIEWLKRHYPGYVVPRSACLGCPYHTDDEWRRIKQDPEAWADVVEVDRAIRHADGLNGEVYLHRSCKPLEEVDLNNDVDYGQDMFGFASECMGYCGN